MSRGTPRLPAPLLDLWDWQSQAECRDVNPDLFFSPESERGVRKRARETVAKSLCRTCPVQTECRQHALKVGEPYGVWGGTTESERDAELLAGNLRSA